MSIPNHILDQLNSQADLVGIIGKHTTLKKAGREFKGNCPFHGEKTPSFYVNPQKNVYNCFGCGVGGNAITFLREYENQTFMEAVRELSRQTGIEIPEEDNKNLKYKRNLNKSTSTNNQPAHSNPNQNNSSTIKYDENSSTEKTTGKPSNFSDNSSTLLPTSLPTSTDIAFDTVKDGIPLSNSEIYSNEMEYYQNNRSSDIAPSDIAPSNIASSNIATQDYDSQSLNGSDYDSYLSTPNTNNTPVDNSLPEEGNLYELLIKICEFYQNCLHNNSQALTYFKQRDLTDKTIEEFKLGYAPSGWQHLETAFPQDIEGLKALGLVRKSEKGRDYDLLRNRVIFPIRDNQGRVIGFAGRSLDNEVKPKYINSSDSPVFHKQHVLYGYYESRQHRANDWLVVEGYMDVIALYQAGIYGAVASMGTAINESQISKLLQLNPTLTLCFDGDSAGQKAAWRTLEVALPVLSDDKELRFLTLPSGHDPDTFIAMHGVDAMREQIKRAMPLSQYIFAYLSERYDLSMAEGKAKLMSQVRQLTNNLPKGSSFKYLLNNDIYQKLGGRKSQKNSAHDALLDFDSDMTVSRQLELCLLFSPNLLSEDPIQKLWEKTGVTEIQMHAKLQQAINSGKISAPVLPSWQDFDNKNLTSLINTITSLSPHLPNDTNAAAHYILATLPPQQQQTLAKRWHPFWSNLNQRGVIDIDELVDDLLVQLMLQALSKQMSQSKNIMITSHLNRQRQTLNIWLKQKQAEQSAKIG